MAKAKKKPAKTKKFDYEDAFERQTEIAKGYCLNIEALEAKLKAAEAEIASRKHAAREAIAKAEHLTWESANQVQKLIQCETRLAAYGKAVEGQAAYIAAREA